MLRVELDYRDPNGEMQTVSRSVSLFPSGRLVAVKPNSWFASKKSTKFQVAVTDTKGKAIAHAPVSVDFLERKTYSHRKRLVGGFYSYDSKTELKRHGQACTGTTDERGLLDCEATPPSAGNLILEAKTSDEAGREVFGNSSLWVSDSTDDWWFPQDNSDRIDLLPERKRYEPGEKAVFQVRMPFREATALVTVEREGVMDAFVVPLSGTKPVIEVPIRPDFAPNVYVSAFVVRGRVGDPQPTALVDLGRPSYKLGIAQINVGWKAHELTVRVEPAKDVLQVREKGRFKIQVKTASGEALPKGAEVALAAVDEGLLQLKSNESWKLLDAMMRKRGYEVETFTAQGEVVGKRHFGLKAMPTGGDGGKAPSREIFDSLLYWDGKVQLNSNGEAEVQFPMNDSVTGFKVAAIAHAGSHLFGTGVASIRTTQDLMILSGVPPLAREGDHMPLEFSLRNTTSRPMSVAVSGSAPGVTALAQQMVDLGPGEVKQVKWTVDVPSGVSEIRYALSAKDKQSSSGDQIQVLQKVVPAVPVRVYQATLAQIDGKFETPVEKPSDALPGKGGIRAVMDSTLLTGLDGVRAYMSEYPYNCLEQRTSRAVALKDQAAWQKVVSDLPTYLDSDGLAKYFPSIWATGSEVLTAYLLSISNEAGWEIPASSKKKMIEGMKRFVEGKIVRPWDFLPSADLTVRKLAGIEALSRYGEAKWSMTGSFTLSPELWPTSAVIDWLEALKRIKDAPDGPKKRTHAEQILRSRLNFQGTTMGFSTEATDGLWWMMVSPAGNAVRLLLSVTDSSSWKDDIGRLARGTLQKQKHGHWDTTTANAWGVLALEKFSKTHEKAAVTGSSTATVTGQSGQSVAWASTPKGKTLDFEWPKQAASFTATHSGGGKPWITLQSRAAIPLKEPFSTGYRVAKTVTPVEQKVSGKWSRGDIARVRLEMEAQVDMTWVVVDDPIPAGAMILGSGLGNDSGVSTAAEKSKGWVEPAFQERSFRSYRAYYSYVPKGKWMTEYTVRFNQSGQMSLPATRLEAMYAPEMLGESPNAAVSIDE